MKYLVYVMIILLFTVGCRNKNIDNIKIIYFDQGIEKEIKIDNDLNDIKEQVEKLILGTDDKLRLQVDQDLIDELKIESTGIEIEFAEALIVHSDKYQDIEVDKLCIPFSGEFVKGYTKEISTIFLANKGYTSGPLVNTNGYKYIEEIKSILSKY